MKNDYCNSVNIAMQRMLGYCCWAVACGPNTWTNMALKLGAMIPRTHALPRKTNPRSIQQYDSEFTLYVQGPWSLVVTEAGMQKTLQHCPDALNMAGRVLTGATLLDAKVVLGVGAEFKFSNMVSLVIHQQRLISQEHEEPILTVLFQIEYFTVMSDGTITWFRKNE